jgi:membrane protein DedA with SNARE-associated domain
MSLDFAFGLLLAYKYWLFLPIAILIGGPVLALLAGALTSLGYLEPTPTYIMLLVCDLVPDTAYYFIGHSMNRKTFAEKYGKKIGLHHGRLDFIEKLWKEHTFKSMIISKWSYGLSGPLLMSAGLVKMSFRKYLIYTFTITMAQYVLLYWLGYTYGASYKMMAGYVHYFELLIILMLAITMIVYTFITRFIKTRFQKAEHLS